jgi:soluble lytic murein transglycosylase-like protein
MPIGLKINHCLTLLTALLLSAQPVYSQTDPQAAQTDPELRALLQEAILSDSGFQDRFEAEVWLLDMSNRLARFVEDPATRVTILRFVHHEATRANLTPELVLALIEVESHFDEFAISVAGARGLMQIMPFWLDEMNLTGKNLFNIQTNLRMGCTILSYYLNIESGNLTRALGRYNGSLGQYTYPQKVTQALNNNWFKQ